MTTTTTYAGNGKPIDAVRVYYNTPNDIVTKYRYQEAQYRVSPVLDFLEEKSRKPLCLKISGSQFTAEKGT